MVAIAIAPTGVAGTVLGRDLRPARFPAICGHRNKSGEVNLTPFRDLYNFNPSNRSWKGEAMTFIGRSRCPNKGKPFLILLPGQVPVSASGVIRRDAKK